LYDGSDIPELLQGIAVETTHVLRARQFWVFFDVNRFICHEDMHEKRFSHFRSVTLTFALTLELLVPRV